MREHWVQTLVNSMAAKIIAFALLGLLAVAVIMGVFTNKHVKIFGIEFNNESAETKTVYVDTGKTVTLRDTVKFTMPFETKQPIKTNPTTAKTKGNSQHIDSGGSGLQNNAPNYGNQAGRDLYVQQEKTLTPNDIFLMEKAVNFFSKAYNLHYVEIVVPMGAKTSKSVAQVEEAMYSLGYSGDKNNLSVFYAGDLSPSDNITYDTSGHKISIMLFCN